MDWFKSKGGQVIALVTIVGTLAGFGYTGATYVNRIENLEAKVVTITTTKSGLQDIEKRFEVKPYKTFQLTLFFLFFFALPARISN